MLFILPTVAALALVLLFWRRQKTLAVLRREAFIRTFSLPPGLVVPLRARHPQLTLKDCQLVAQGLRQFFLAYLKSGQRYVSMPSQVVDDLWHEFILHTREYQAFCHKAFGQFLHHTPAAALGRDAERQSDDGLRRTWQQACREENINPAQPSRLPLLFALDTKLKIAQGFHYVADCQSLRRQGDSSAGSTVVHCGSDLHSSSLDSDSSPSSSSSSDSDSSRFGGDGGSDAGGDSSGCGGGGCGGGGGD
ncbi:MAG: glycine-rich domain-containing protein [Pseudomonas sp.]|uniref:glycine-rich domain-containing protein n=1 Tax=Pseudomonas sp. TaxID=306 RepID=UPI003D0F46A8